MSDLDFEIVLFGFACSVRNMDALDHLLHVLGRRRGEGTDRERDGEVDQHTYESNSFGRDAEKILVSSASEKLEIDNVSTRENDATYHPCNATFAVHAFGENAHQQCREE